MLVNAGDGLAQQLSHAERAEIRNLGADFRRNGNRVADRDLGEIGRGEPLVNNDPELTAYLEALRDRPEMRALFRLSQHATREDVETAVTILEALRSKHEDT